MAPQSPTLRLLKQIRGCRVCAPHLAHPPRPILQVHPDARILIVGQAPGLKVHESGIPWDDASGDRLRLWMGIDKKIFYDPRRIAIVPMGFCYPGKGKSGDLPPRRECFPLWHRRLLEGLSHIQLTILVGSYAQAAYLASRNKENLSATVRSFRDYLPEFLPLPHPSPLNNIWLSKNRWFHAEVEPEIKKLVRPHVS